MKLFLILSAICLTGSSLCAHAEPVQDPVEALVAKAAHIAKRETGSAPTLQVKLRTDQLVYRAGDKLQAFVTVPPGSHVRLYYKDAEGGVTVLFPNSFSPNSQLPGGLEIPLPGPNDQWDIVIDAKPSGREYLALVVSDLPFADAAELTTAIQRDGGQAQMGNLRIEEVAGKGPRAMLVDPKPQVSSSPVPAPVSPKQFPSSKLGIAMVEITTSDK
ncbi:MAG: protein of unknown function DUF4384 [Verrucomicrobia bacterium]|jgi:hypothetical protein|nr:MAG: protein of unknown function DUF4384 [Verrucomicrobiota bacterium]